jgi:capsule polysaccharide export protein KpsC/LpsZ
VDISIYNATTVAPSLIEERASLVDGNEVDTGDDVMADGSENLMLKLKFLPYKVQSQLPMSQYRTCNVLLAINQGPGSLKVWFCNLRARYTARRPKKSLLLLFAASYFPHSKWLSNSLQQRFSCLQRLLYEVRVWHRFSDG